MSPAPSFDVRSLSPLPPDSLLTREQVAALLQIKPRQVERLGVPCLRLGHRTLRYRRSEVERWVAERAERG